MVRFSFNFSRYVTLLLVNKDMLFPLYQWLYHLFFLPNCISSPSRTMLNINRKDGHFCFTFYYISDFFIVSNLMISKLMILDLALCVGIHVKYSIPLLLLFCIIFCICCTDRGPDESILH